MKDRRGPIDVHLAPDFHQFMKICKTQQEEQDNESSSDSNSVDKGK